MSDTEGPGTFTNVLMIPISFIHVMCVLKVQKSQELLYEMEDGKIYVRCGCENPMGYVEALAASSLMDWMEKGWMFICTAQQRVGSELMLQFSPLRGIGKSATTTTEKPVDVVKTTPEHEIA